MRSLTPVETACEMVSGYVAAQTALGLVRQGLHGDFGSFKAVRRCLERDFSGSGSGAYEGAVDAALHGKVGGEYVVAGPEGYSAAPFRGAFQLIMYHVVGEGASAAL